MRTRRHFIKTAIFGAAGSSFVACRGGSADPSPKPAVSAPPSRFLAGEEFGACHAVSDGGTWASVPISETHDVAIVGGGPSGLTAAWRLRDRDVVLLEKERVLGGTCTLDEWQGVRMSTGGAFYTETETALVELLREIGAEGTKVRGGDSLVVDGQPAVDFFRDGANALPFPQKVRDDFRRSRDDLVKAYKTRRPEELDAVPFAELLKPYAAEVRRFWDRFGPSNWGGVTAETSGYVGCEAYTWAGGADDPRWTFPGGLGGASHALAEKVQPALGDRVRTGATVYRVDIDGARAVIRYLVHGEPRAMRARAVILALPKYFAAYIMGGIPQRRRSELAATRYAPFPVFNVCLRDVGPEPAYDNWFLDTPFTDFIPADWIVHAGRGPRPRKTVLTVYHPLPESQRGTLLADDTVLEMADGVAAGIEKHFPGTVDKIEQIRVFRRGHPMFIPTPGRMKTLKKLAASIGPIFFANTDSDVFPTFYYGVLAADKAVAGVLKRLG